MVVKKRPVAKRATPAKKAAPARKQVTKGDSYVCGVCGLAVTVDEDCGCVDVCDIICCGKPMKAAKAKAKPKARAKAKPRAKAKARK